MLLPLLLMLCLELPPRGYQSTLLASTKNVSNAENRKVSETKANKFETLSNFGVD
jgi:hypothetical protein